MGGMDGYRILSNRESGDGRGDIFIKPYRQRNPAIVIEVKIVKALRDLQRGCDDALAQIEEKGYEEELLYEGYKKVIKYGIAFYRKSCQIEVAKQVEV